MVPEAVRDAKANAEANGISNCDLFAGRAEDILPSVLARATAEEVVAIVDPPRAGLRELKCPQGLSAALALAPRTSHAFGSFLDTTSDEITCCGC